MDQPIAQPIIDVLVQSITLEFARRDLDYVLVPNQLELTLCQRDRHFSDINRAPPDGMTFRYAIAPVTLRLLPPHEKAGSTYECTLFMSLGCTPGGKEHVTAWWIIFNTTGVGACFLGERYNGPDELKGAEGGAGAF